MMPPRDCMITGDWELRERGGLFAEWTPLGRYNRRKETATEEFSERGRDYITGYLASFERHPIRRFVVGTFMTKEAARYQAAKSVLEKLEI